MARQRADGDNSRETGEGPDRWPVRLSRRRVVNAGVLALGAGPLLQACGGPAAPSATAPTSQPAGSTAQTGTPAAAKITGKFVVLQHKDWNPHHNDYLNQQVTKFAEQNRWPLDLSYEAGFTGGSNFYQKLGAAVAAGDSPDMMFGAYNTFLLWDLKTLQPVDDLASWATKAYGDPIPGLKLSNNFKDHWWAAPFFTRTDGWWARKSWFDPIGFDINGDHDLQEWLEACVKVSDASKQRWGWGNTVNRSGDGERNVREPVFQAGGRYTDQSGTKVVFNSSETIAAYGWLKDVYTNPKWAPALPPGVSSWTDPSNNEAWIAGTIGFTSNAGTLFAQAVTDTPEIGKDSYLVPQPKGPVGKKERLTGAGGATLFLFAGAKNPDAAKQVMQYLLSKDIQKQIWETSPGYTCPAYKWGWDEPTVVNSPSNVDKIFEKIVYGQSFFTWMPGPEPKLWINAVGEANVLTDTMADILKGTAIKDAVAAAHASIEKIRDKHEGK